MHLREGKIVEARGYAKAQPAVNRVITPKLVLRL
jgi:hypothetical protein